MYLSKLTLDPRHPQARRDLGDAYEMHRTLARAFAPDQGLLDAIDAYAQGIHPWRDGQSSRRVIEATDALLRGELGRLRRKPLAGLWRNLKLRSELGYWGR